MNNDFTELFNKYFNGTDLKKLHKNLRMYRFKWMNKNQTHVEFLSSNLMGVHPIRFTKDDEEEFFETMLHIDVKELTKELYKVKGIYKERKVSSNPMYNTCIYMMHLFQTSNMKKEDKDSAIREIFLIATYKMFSSLMSHNFSFNLDIDIANTLYETISKRYLIRQLGSWEAVFEYRSNDVICPEGLHCERITKVDGVKSSYAISDIQGRYRSMFKELYAVINEIINNNEKRLTTSLNSKDLDGQDAVSDVNNLNKNYFMYIDNIIYKKADFVKEDILLIVSEMFKNVKKDDLRAVLNYMSDEYLKDNKRIKSLIEHSLKANINYLNVNKMNPPYDLRIVSVVRHLKGFWSSSKVKDPDLKKAKKLVYSISKDVTKKKTKWLTVSLGMSVSVYIFFRAVLKDSYK